MVVVARGMVVNDINRNTGDQLAQTRSGGWAHCVTSGLREREEVPWAAQFDRGSLGVRTRLDPRLLPGRGPLLLLPVEDNGRAVRV